MFHLSRSFQFHFGYALITLGSIPRSWVCFISFGPKCNVIIMALKVTQVVDMSKEREKKKIYFLNPTGSNFWAAHSYYLLLEDLSCYSNYVFSDYVRKTFGIFFKKNSFF